MTRRDQRADCQRLWGALTACPPLDLRSPQRDHLWVVVRDVICTRSAVAVTPMGSTHQVVVTADYAGNELEAAMTWLHGHEQDARQLTAKELFVRLRGVATKGPRGSARAAQADALRGVTGVGRGQPVRWGDLEEAGVA